MADARREQPGPGKFFAGVLFAARRHVGMRQDAVRPDKMPAHNVPAQSNHLPDLRLGKIRIAEIVPRIGDLDADRARVDVLLAFPAGNAGMPGAARLGHALNDAAVVVDEIMRGYAGLRIAADTAQTLERRLGAFHPGVVQHDHVRTPMTVPLAVVRRGLDRGHDRRIRRKARHGYRSGMGRSSERNGSKAAANPSLSLYRVNSSIRRSAMRAALSIDDHNIP